MNVFCTILSAWTIVGAVEVKPNWIHVDYLDQNKEVGYIVIPKKYYTECEVTEVE